VLRVRLAVPNAADAQAAKKEIVIKLDKIDHL
jgi:hypothetical protein